MKTILITAHYIKADEDNTCFEHSLNLSQCLALIEGFKQQGYSVTLGYLGMTRQLIECMLDHGVELCLLPDVSLKHRQFDVLWAHHHTSFYAVVEQGHTIADVIIFDCLSGSDVLDLPPMCDDIIHLYLTNNLIYQANLVDLGVRPEKIDIHQADVQKNSADYCDHLTSLLNKAALSKNNQIRSETQNPPNYDQYLQRMLHGMTTLIAAHADLTRNSQNMRTESDLRISILETELQSVYASKSWRISAPLRWFSDGVRFLRHRIQQPFLQLIKKNGISGFIKKSKTILKQNGVRQYFECIKRHTVEPRTRYENWLGLYEINRPERSSIVVDKDESEKIVPQRVISILMVVDKNVADWALESAIASVCEQTYPHLELCIVDQSFSDITTTEGKCRTAYYAQRDPRITAYFQTEVCTQAAALNYALARVNGTFMLCLRPEDLLASNALAECVSAIQQQPDTLLFYTDEDQIDVFGKRSCPYFKSDWNPDLFLSQNLMGQTGIYQTELIRAVGGFDAAFEGAELYDLTLRCLARVGNIVGHIPKVLYHVATNTNISAKKGQSEQQAIRAYLARNQIDAGVSSTKAGYRIRYALPDNLPLVSIIIPTRDGKALVEQCITSLLNKTQYENYEILLVDNGSTDPISLEYFASLSKHPKINIIRDERPFNYSALNNHAAQQAKGSIICLLNNDIEVINEDWLDEMVSQALRPEIGAVGARLLYPNQRIQHAGLILGTGKIVNTAWHIFRNLASDDSGYFNKVALVQNYCAVTAACLVVKKSLFDQMGGLDDRFAVAFNDVDFCLRLHQAGYRNLYTPYATLYHYESATRGQDDTPVKQLKYLKESHMMKQRYSRLIAQDPYYNPNLDVDQDYALAFPPRQYTLK